MGKAIPVETCLGYLLYRDSLDLLSIKSNGVDWYLFGKINGHNVTKNPMGIEEIPLEIEFSYVQKIFNTENSHELNYTIDENESDPSCFHTIDDSFLIKSVTKNLPGTDGLKHYRLKTVDGILHIIARGYTLNIA